MHRLLLDLTTAGYPRDFLLARLHGRRQRRSRRTGRMGEPLTDPWSTRQKELCWIYKTMDQKTRREFGLCFLYFELRRLLIALRRLAGQSREGLEQLKREPLLNRQLVRSLQGAATVVDAARRLDAALTEKNRPAPRLEQIFLEQGGRKMEEHLVNLFFCFSLSREHKAPLRHFFAQLIDLQNLLALLKSQRWELPEPPVLLPGGTYTPQQWQVLLRPGQELKLRQTVKRLSGSAEFSAESVEHAVSGRILRSLHRQARSVPDPFLILYYLWAGYLQTRNLGLQHWGGEQLAAWERFG